MVTHVLWQVESADFDVWLKLFREDKPKRKVAGIQDLHVRRDSNQRGHASVMYEVLGLGKV